MQCSIYGPTVESKSHTVSSTWRPNIPLPTHGYVAKAGWDPKLDQEGRPPATNLRVINASLKYRFPEFHVSQVFEIRKWLTMILMG